MSLTYPLNLPATPAFRSVVFRAPKEAGVARSMFTGSSQVQESQGEWLEVDAALPPMLRAKAAPWVATLTSLRGPVGTFLLGDPSAKTPRGTVAGSLVVSGGSQTGSSLLTTGGTGTLLQHDWIQLGSGATQRIYMCMKDVTLGTGVTVEIYPKLRESPGNGDAITYTNCKGLFRLSESGKTGWSVNEAKVFGITFQAIEAI